MAELLSSSCQGHLGALQTKASRRGMIREAVVTAWGGAAFTDSSRKSGILLTFKECDRGIHQDGFNDRTYAPRSMMLRYSLPSRTGTNGAKVPTSF